MTGPLDEPEDATPLTPEERDGLIPSHVMLRGELNELEQQNILEADIWALSRRMNPVSEVFGRGFTDECLATSGAGREPTARLIRISASIG
jgi:hypothetical protein